MPDLPSQKAVIVAAAFAASMPVVRGLLRRALRDDAAMPQWWVVPATGLSLGVLGLAAAAGGVSHPWAVIIGVIGGAIWDFRRTHRSREPMRLEDAQRR